MSLFHDDKKGYFVMYDKWFDEYVLAAIINKKYISKETLQILETEPKVLEPWESFASDLKFIE